MGLQFESSVDDISRQILQALQEDARISFSELGRQVGLSAPAVAERVRRLEEAGIITGYRAEVDPAKMGLSICAFIRISTSGARERRTVDLIRACPEVLECHRVTGSDCFILKVVVTSIPHLEDLIDRLSPCGELVTSVVLSSPV